MKGRSKVLSALAVSTVFLAMSGCSGEESESCVVSSDCGDTSVYRCDVSSGKCVEISPKHCSDKAKNDDETDVDCGGSCGACSEGKTCAKNSDCSTGACDEKTLKCVKKTCTENADCKAMTDGTCYLADDNAGYCVSCSNGQRDGDETDIDCGGSCSAKCINGKACLSASDCVNGTCESNVCAGEAPIAGDIDKMLINEAMAQPNTKATFDLQSSGAQCDFIEIVNKSDKAQTLDGITLHIMRVEGGKSDDSMAHALTGTLPAKGALVVLNKGCSLTAPEGVGINQHAKDNFLVASPAEYDLWLSDASGKEGTKVHATNGGSGVSMNRATDRDDAAELVKHNTISIYSNSPGYCANGGMFIDNCVVADTCSNNKHDGDETDIDCGGKLCPKCEIAGNCLDNSDCKSGLCSEGKCAVKTCAKDADCDPGYECNADTQQCVAQPTCSDGIKNQDETDVDCGGATCGACAAGKTCAVNRDCVNLDCVSGACSDKVFDKATINDVFINEVMGSPKSQTKFELQAETDQCEFVEIVNKTDKQLDLSGLSLVGYRDDAEPASINVSLSANIPAKGVFVVGENDIPMPSDGVFARATLGIANAALYTFAISDGENESARVTRAALGTPNGKSQNRNPDNSDADPTLVLHDKAGTSFKNSPGYCANGGLFSNDCITECENNQLDDGETDIDCGGDACPACAIGKNCAADGDCDSQYCDGNTKKCAEKPCGADNPCPEGKICNETTHVCEDKPTCDDGIKNQDETDVDCGGSACGACPVTKACKTNSDCLSGDCQSQVCTGEDPTKADVTKLFVNEVMGSPKNDADFEVSVGVTKQVEFVEILNANDKAVTLDGITLILTKCTNETECPDDNKTRIPLKGVVQKDSFIVVSKDVMPGLPVGCLSVAGLPTATAITNSSYYEVYLTDDGDSAKVSPKAIRKPNSATGKSQNRSNELQKSMTDGERLIFHDKVTTHETEESVCPTLNHSPGYCANGGLYKFECAIDAQCNAVTY